MLLRQDDCLIELFRSREQIDQHVGDESLILFVGFLFQLLLEVSQRSISLVARQEFEELDVREIELGERCFTRVLELR